jgi:hypothetical protein
MVKRRWTRLVGGIVVGLLLAGVWYCWTAASSSSLGLPLGRLLESPQQAFYRHHPGEKPLNWKIAAAAEKIRTEQAMGKFRLGIEPGKLGNDCSDYVACAVDEGLGLGGRCYHPEREDHVILSSLDWSRAYRYMDYFYWRPGTVVMPGDMVRVTHSPHYAPHPGACSHVGIVGTDGLVYDFSKLKRWPEARYGTSEFSWFTRHCGDREVVIGRLKDVYRFLQRPIAVASP